MTVQFILPEAISFPKERKLHDRLFLVLLYNLLCKTFKDHSSTFAASSRIRAHPSLARALLPDCECKGRAFLHSLQDFDEKKCEKNSFAPILPLHSVAKSAVKSVFSLDPLPIIFAPKPPFFVRFGHFWGKNRLFRGISFFSALDFLAQNLILRRKNKFDGKIFRPKYSISTLADEEKEKVGVFSSNPRRNNIKMKKGGAEIRKPRTKSKRTSWKNKKRRTKHIRASQKRPSTTEQDKLVLIPSPTPLEKYKPTFSQNFSTFRDFLPCFSQNLPTPHKTPFTLRAGHAPTRIYAPAHSANLPFLPSPFTSSHNKLCINRLRVKANPAFTFTFTATS